MESSVTLRRRFRLPSLIVSYCAGTSIIIPIRSVSCFSPFLTTFHHTAAALRHSRATSWNGYRVHRWTLLRVSPGGNEEDNIGDNKIGGAADDFFDGYEDFMASWGQDSDDNVDSDSNDDGPWGGSGGRQRRPTRRFGRRSSSHRGGGGDDGNDYTRAPDDATASPSTYNVDVDAINNLLSERVRCKKRGKFDRADDIRDILRDKHGVQIWDRERIWTTDPNSRGGSARHRGNGRYAASSRDGGRGGRGGGRDRNAGSRERYQRRNPGKDRDFGPRGHDYARTGGPIDTSVCDISEEEIDMLLAERLQCKLKRDFGRADEIQRWLGKEKGVMIHDGRKKWRADGQPFGEEGEYTDGELRRRRFGQPGRERRSSDEVRQYRRVGTAGRLTDEQLGVVAAALARRSEAQREGRYDFADAVRDKLKSDYNVSIDDRNLEWHVRRDYYVRSEESGLLPDELMEVRGEESGEVEDEQPSLMTVIDAKVAMRMEAKKDRDYAAADAIREELWETYKVEIDDRLKEWSVAKQSPGEEIAPAEDIEPDEEEEEEEVHFGTWEMAEEDDGAKVDDDEEGEEEELELGTSELDSYFMEAVTGMNVEEEDSSVPDITESSENSYFMEVAEGTDVDEDATSSVPDISTTSEDLPQNPSKDTEDPEAFSPDIGDDDDDLESLTVVLLKDRLREAGLKVSGRKAELIARLRGEE